MATIDEQLEDALEELEGERKKVARGNAQVGTAIDILADLGIIDNTPQYKRMYMDGERKLPRG